MIQFNKKEMMPVNVCLALDSVRNITIETGKLARQADGSVVVRMGNTMLLATCVSKTEDVLKVGDTIDVMLKSIDEKTGKISLSRKALIPKPSANVVVE